MRAAPIAVSLLVASLASAAPALADRFYPTRSDRLVERGHRVTIALAHDHAKIRVEREVFNGGERPDQATFFFSPPPSAVAVGLRTLGALNGSPHWFEGDLLEAEEAAHRYTELTGLGGYYPKDPALLSWRDQNELALQVFPCMPGVSKRVDVTLVAPMKYEAGRYLLDLSPMGSEGLWAEAKITREDGKSSIFVDGQPWKGGALTLSSPHVIGQEASFYQPVEGGLASVPFGPSRVASSFFLNAKPKLSSIPTGARVVVVVDLSRSVDEGARAAAFSAATAMLSHFSDRGSKALVLGFARAPRSLTPGFVAVEDAIKALDASAFAGENGSEVGLAIAEADRLLIATSPTARRIVVLTDLETREKLTPETAKTTLRSGAVLHIATVLGGESYNWRDDTDPWAALPRATGGVLFRAQTTTDAESKEARLALFEEWARPVKIDRVRVTAPGMPGEHGVEIDSLVEGEGIERRFFADRDVPFVLFEGELWSRPVTHSFSPDKSMGDRFAALIFGTELLSELSEPEMMTLAMRGGAVSPVTSYLAIEPGVRPSTEGLDASEGSGQGFGSGAGRLGGSRRRGPPRLRSDPTELLAALLRPLVSACGLTPATTEIEIETTRIEIVDVTLSHFEGDAKARACVVDGAFAVMLPGDFDLPHGRYSVPI